MNKERKLLWMVFLLSAAVLVFISSRMIFAADTGDDVGISEATLDTQLTHREVPTDVLAKMDYFQKLMIMDHLDEAERFEGYSEYAVEFYEDGRLKMILNPKSEMTLEVAVFKNGSTYNFFPSFKWASKVRVNNDQFSFSLDERYWKTTAGDVELDVYLQKDAEDDVKNFFHYDRPSSSTFQGHGFNILNQDGRKNGRYYSGHAHFKAESLADETDSKITVSYTRDPAYVIELGLFSFAVDDDEAKIKEATYPLIWAD